MGGIERKQGRERREGRNRRGQEDKRATGEQDSGREKRWPGVSNG